MFKRDATRNMTASWSQTKSTTSPETPIDKITEGYITSIRLTAYQIKLQLEGGRNITLWKRRFNTQWGGGKACDSALQRMLCESQGDSAVPVLSPGVRVSLTMDPGRGVGHASPIHCVSSLSTPTCGDSRRMRVYANAVAAWACGASTDLTSALEHKRVSGTVRALLQGTGVPAPKDLEEEAHDFEPDTSGKVPAMSVAVATVAILSTAVHRVNIRTTLEHDALSIPGGIAAAELDNLAAVLDSYQRFRTNPFGAAMGGSGKRPQFKTLDAYAQVFGIPLSKRRIAAVVYRLQLLRADAGHSCFSLAELVATPLLHWTSADVEASIREGIEAGVLRLDGLGGEDVYLAPTHEVETRVGMRFAALCRGGEVALWAERVRSAAFQTAVGDMLATTNGPGLGCLLLDDVQLGAVHTCLTGMKDLLVLSGYPGTGKSRVSQAIRCVCEAAGLKVLVCAPTAKAASRLGNGATTVHRALGAQPSGGGEGGFRFGHHEGNPLDADLVLVDEVSMMDMTLTAALLRACSCQRTRLVFVGDVNQLPSVEWGNVLGALIESSNVPRVFLENIYRQQQNVGDAVNTIWPLARSIALGGPLLRADLRSSTVTWSADDSREGVSEALLALHAEHGDKLQIISPSRRHGLHTCLLNEVILNRPPGRWDLRFEVGDRVVVTKNQPLSSLDTVRQAPPMNGDCGTVLGRAPMVAHTHANAKDTLPCEDRHVLVRLDDQRIDRVPHADLDHAYAITTHKAQGSEYDVVAVVLSSQHGKALNRQALYTSVSRAVKRLFLFASRETLGTCVNTLSERRQGHLTERIDLGVALKKS